MISKVIWFTGLSGSGKTTVAAALQTYNKGVLLDGDAIRKGLCSDLGFSDSDRSENIRRVSHMAKLIAETGKDVIVSLISPFAKDRESARNILSTVLFYEVFIDTSLEECIRRDPKGLYAKNPPNLTGISSAYERPKNPNITIETMSCDPNKAAQYIYDLVYPTGVMI
jgi:adenylyl-sulfate kinase